MLFHSQKKDVSNILLNLKINDSPIERVANFNFLGITLNENLKWNSHIDKMAMKVSKYIGILKKLKHYLQGYILKTLYDSLIMSQLNYGILAWGFSIDRLTKLQKKAVPLSPILSMINSPQHKIAKFLNRLLEPVLHYYSDYVIKDSFSFVETIRNIKANNTFVASFDVKSLFTNVPLKEVIDISTDKLYLLAKPTLKKKEL